MASQDTSATQPRSPDTDMDTFPNPQVARSEAGDVASILSSRMTDIASDDGGEYAADPTGRSAAQTPGQRRSTHTTGDGASRPNTAMTGVSSQRGAWGQSPPSRRGYGPGNTIQRGSTVGSISGSTGPRPQSSSRTHVPSLTSHAFFRPMSSQRLQAQRSSRPAVMGRQSEDGSAEGGSSVARHSVNSNKTIKQGHSVHEGEGPPPPSRGTEMTEQETAERVTANTSPTHGHHPTGSLSESVRPLQRNPVNNKGLSLNIDKSYKNGGNLPTPSKSPRSFRSSFLLPTRGGCGIQHRQSKYAREGKIIFSGIFSRFDTC
ncbi:hypothetical protein G7Y89_g7508 [Cudoniella acicularis]|uniref:Uncharacterized protein n=1 Tax=Cudoniella acicularis TaxID=354080 RepID=A0A8H4W4H3_9HELO|nr:hypothetical protein G7Y89_g7508 [Cudoniella acicularis]